MDRAHSRALISSRGKLLVHENERRIFSGILGCAGGSRQSDDGTDAVLSSGERSRPRICVFSPKNYSVHGGRDDSTSRKHYTRGGDQFFNRGETRHASTLSREQLNCSFWERGTFVEIELTVVPPSPPPPDIPIYASSPLSRILYISIITQKFTRTFSTDMWKTSHEVSSICFLNKIF